jgi:ATP-dependent Clp protease ATP-binding subunit ClpX
MESVMLDMMYHIPSEESVSNCRVTKDLVVEKMAVEAQELKKLGAGEVA